MKNAQSHACAVQYDASFARPSLQDLAATADYGFGDLIDMMLQ